MKIFKKPFIKMISRMSIYVFILLIASPLSSNNTLGQSLEKTKVSIFLNDATVVQIFKAIEEQSSFYFVYDSKISQNTTRISFNDNSISVRKVLEKVSREARLKFRRVNQSISVNVIPKKEVEITIAIVREISGKVTDQNDEPLPGVNILVKGTNIGTSTDFDGNFTLEIPDDAQTIVVSYLGYQTQEISVEGKSNFDIKLEEDASTLEEVVIVGYGTQKKYSVSGSISAVQSAELIKVPTTTVTELLSGRIAGLITKQQAGTPGNDATSVNIRGFGTALVIVDGIETSMTRLDPNDIESVSVLKDASAAVYGSRAGNGVILVTTKRGKIGKAKISYHGNTSFQAPTKSRNYVDSWEYAILIREADLNGNSSLDDTYTEEDVAKFKAGTDPNYVNEDWNAAVFKDWTPMSQHNLNVRGGYEKVKYFASAGLLEQESAYKSGDLNFFRYNARTNLDAQINKSLSFSIDLSYRRENRDSPATSVSTMYNLLQTAQPIWPANLPDLDRAAYSGFTTRSPYAATQKKFGGFDNDIREFFTGKIELKYKFDFGLTAKTTMNYQTLNTSKKSLRKPYTIWSYNYDTSEYTDLGTYSSRSSITEVYRKRIQLYPSFSLEYKKLFGEHSINVLALVETIDLSDESILAKRFDLISTDIPYLSSGHPETQENNSSASESGRKSYVGRFNYNYKNKYFLEGTIRADATGEKFAIESRWGYFPSFSAAWRISEENFTEQFSAIDNLKLRLSYSQTGLDNVGNFRYLTGFNILNSTYLIDGGAGQIIRSNGLPNKNITWLDNTLYNIGIDGSFWNGLLGFEIDAFYRLTEGLFGTNQQNVPSTFGAILPQENINKRDDRGFDIVVNHRNAINDNLDYKISANVGWARSKWVEFSETEYTDADDIRLKQNEGNYTNRIIGYLSDGMFMTQEEIDNHPVDQDGNENSTLKPGDIKYIDRSGDGAIGEEDRDDIGYGSTPDISYGLNLVVNYKNFTLSTLFQGAGLFNMNISGAARGGFSNQSTPYDYQLKYAWRPDYNNPGVNVNPDTRLPMITHNGVTPNNKKTSDFWLLDNTYLRLKSVNLNYSVNQDIVNKIGVNYLDIYASGTNLFSFSRLGIYKNTFDVEGPATQSGRSYPIMKTITFGVRITL